MPRLTTFAALAAAALSVSACIPSPEAEFWGRVSSLCGEAYEGEIVSEDAADDDWRSQRIVIHVRDCSKSEIRIPLSVGRIPHAPGC